MKISFPKYGSGAGISIRAAINALLNWHKAERTQNTARKKNVPRITSQWDYRPRKAIRAAAVIDTPSAETCDVLSPDLFVTNNNLWFSDDSLEGAAPTFVNRQPDGEELITKVVPETKVL